MCVTVPAIGMDASPGPISQAARRQNQNSTNKVFGGTKPTDRDGHGLGTDVRGKGSVLALHTSVRSRRELSTILG